MKGVRFNLLCRQKSQRAHIVEFKFFFCTASFFIIILYTNFGVEVPLPNTPPIPSTLLAMIDSSLFLLYW
jgi:hypothetical protein